jgi:hypothetical protein
MRRHIIRTFVGVLKHSVTIGHNFFHERFQVCTYCRVGIFTQYQGCAGMVYKYLADTLFDTRAMYHLVDLLADIKSATAPCGKSKLLLVNHNVDVCV